MASWIHIRDYLRANFKIAEDDGERMSLVFETHERRSQLVVVEKSGMEAFDEEFATVWSPIADARSVDPGAVLRAASEYVIGGVVQYDDMLVLRHAVPLSNLDINELIGPLEVVVHCADQLEERFAASDAF